MNELRMYVEHLFKGRTLTDDAIELKEEIYGNLVARYEDYLRGGMTSEEALSRAKESITSIDEVLDGLAGEDAEATASAAAPAVAASTATLDAVDVAGAAGGTPAEGDDPTGVAAVAGYPAAAGAKSSHKKRPLAVALIAVIILLLVVGVAFAATRFGAKAADEAADEVAEVNAGASAATSGASAAGAAASATSAASSTSSSGGTAGGTRSGLTAGDYALSVDADGNVSLSDTRADEVAQAVVASSFADVSPYASSSLSATDDVSSLVGALPMAGWLNGQASVSGSVLALSYLVSDAIDGDSVELAMVYDATAIFCAMEDCSEIRFTIAESDEPADQDLYVFTRDALEQAYGIELSSGMVTEEGWKQLKNENLYRGEFAERAAEAAEQER